MNAGIDSNGRQTLTALSSTGDGSIVTLYANPTTHRLLVDLAGGSGTVTTVSVVSANGFAGTVATATSTPAITLTTTVTGLLKGNGTAISAATAGTDYSAGTSALATGILKSTTTTGALSIAVAGDFPTLNQNTTGSAATLTTPRAIYGNNFDGSAALTQIIASTYGGTGNGFTKFSGPATAEKTFTLPNANATLLYDGGALGTPASGTLTNCTGLPIAGLVASTSTALGVGSIELGNASDTTLSRSSAGVLAVEGVTVPTISSTNTLTNKRITKRTGTTTSSATPTINTDNVDFYSLTAQAVDITSFTTNLSGTPTEGQTLWIAITGTGARAITWGASFEASTIALPTTTVSTSRLDVGFVWNSVSSKWRCVATC